VPFRDRPGAAAWRCAARACLAGHGAGAVGGVGGWRVVTDEAGQDDPQSDGPPSDQGYFDRPPALCTAPDGRKRAGWDVEIASNDAFASVRGVACVPSLPDGVGQTAMCLGRDLEGGDAAPAGLPRTAAGSGGAIVVVQEGRSLRVFDVQRRQELGRIALADGDAPPRVHVLADRGWIVVDSLLAGDAMEHLLRGYAIPR